MGDIAVSLTQAETLAASLRTWQDDHGSKALSKDLL
jgi:hypothetical protein